MLNRRQFLAVSAALSGSVLTGAKSKLQIGVTDWNLRMAGEVGAVATAAGLGFEGVEVSLGRKPVGGKLPLDNDELIARYVAAAKQYKIALAGTCLDILHVNYLKNDKLGQKWVGDSIPITRKLNARVVLLPFFGKGALETRAEQEYVGDALKEYAREAEKAGILLGLEDTISAEDNVRILDRVANKHLKVYYDVGNSTNGGFDVLKEIPWLGASRICQFHLKDKGYLGEGAINFPEVMNRITALGFEGFANLETNSPSKVIANDMRRNLDFIRKSMS